MIVPHSNSRVLNFQTNIFSVCFGALLLVGGVASFLVLNKKSILDTIKLSQIEKQSEQTLASFDELKDENNSLLQTAKQFRTTLTKSLDLLGLSGVQDISKAKVSDTDLASIFGVQEVKNASTKEAASIKELNTYLAGAVEPLEQIGKMLQSQGSLFAEIPNIWPLRGGIGHISMPFGQNIHPITGQWYIHKGVDFSTWRSGDPILATANGQVVTVTYAPDFGHYVIIKHKYGIYTRYAHMRQAIVHKGQTVSQGQVIGYVGNSGITTGPHLHYEVHIGSDVVDPTKYINIKVTK